MKNGYDNSQFEGLGDNNDAKSRHNHPQVSYAMILKFKFCIFLVTVPLPPPNSCFINTCLEIYTVYISGL